MVDRDVSDRQEAVRRFVALDEASRTHTIIAIRDIIEVKRRELACLLVAQAAEVLAEAFTMPDRLVFQVSAGYEDPDIVDVVELWDTEGRLIELRPDFAEDHQVIRPVQRLLSEASDLGMRFPVMDDDRYFRLSIGDPLADCTYEPGSSVG